MATLSLRAVGKTYAASAPPVLAEIDLEVADGEFVVIVGPSGCGKSTLLRMIAGLEHTTSGEIQIGPRIVNQLEPKARDVAMVFQNYALYPHMSVAENIAYGLKIRRMPKEKIHERITAAAQMLGLEELLHRKPRELSGGQRQRVAMGRAIVREPALFLFDEPLSNLDAKLRARMRIEIRRLHTQLRTTSLYVTHDQVEAMTLAQRVVVLNKGRIEQIGTPAEIYDTPHSRFVAGFIGSPPMNLLRGHLSSTRQTFQIDGGPTVSLSDNTPGTMPPPALHPGHSCWLGIRPEHVRIPDGNIPSGSGASIPFAVNVCEMLGADNLAYGQWNGQSFVARLPYDQHAQAGKGIELILPTRHLHFFDAENGRRIS